MSLAERIDGAKPHLRPVESDATGIVPSPYLWTPPATIPKREYLYGTELQRKHVSALVAPGAAGKTTYKVARGLAMVTGKNLLGREIYGGPKRVWLWNHEDDREEQTRSIQAACHHYGLTAADLGDRLFLDSAMDGATMKLATVTALGQMTIDAELKRELTATLIDHKIDYLDLDPFVSIHSIEENDNMAVDAVVKALASIANAANCAICVAHHVAKGRSETVDSNSARGAVALTAACRSVLAMNRMSKEEAEGWNIPGEERRRYFKVYDDKNNRAPPADDSDWFYLESVHLENGDNIGVVTPWNPPDVFDGVTTAHLAGVQTLVAKHSSEDGAVRASEQSKARWVGKLVAKVLDLNADDKADRRRIKKILRAWYSSGALVEVNRYDPKSKREAPFVEVGRPIPANEYTPRQSNGGNGVGH
jgi:hypothetical protein